MGKNRKGDLVRKRFLITFRGSEEELLGFEKFLNSAVNSVRGDVTVEEETITLDVLNKVIKIEKQIERLITDGVEMETEELNKLVKFRNEFLFSSLKRIEDKLGTRKKEGMEEFVSEEIEERRGIMPDEEMTCNICGKVYKNVKGLAIHKGRSHQR